MSDFKQYQPKVKNSENVLIGVAQVRIGKPSYRDAGVAAIGPVQAVTKSNIIVDATDAVTEVVRPTATANAGTSTMVASGTYSGGYDGCFILRHNGTTVDIFSPTGYKDAAVTTAEITAGYIMQMESAEASGVTVTGDFTAAAAGDTWIVPVWTANARAARQTGIISPYSMFKGSAESVGGLASASFVPAVDEMATLESGFPAEVVDKIVTKTSAAIKFEAQEYTNANIAHLKNLVSKIINEAITASVPAEVVMRTRGNKLVTFWVPNTGIDNVPEYAPTNDFSTMNWELSGTKMTEIEGETDAYNAWLRNAYLYYELEYIH